MILVCKKKKKKKEFGIQTRGIEDYATWIFPATQNIYVYLDRIFFHADPYMRCLLRSFKLCSCYITSILVDLHTHYYLYLITYLDAFIGSRDKSFILHRLGREPQDTQ